VLVSLGWRDAVGRTNMNNLWDSTHGRRPRVVVVGSYGVGLTISVDRVPDAGETIAGHSFATGHGGKGSNQAVAAARLGADVTLFTAVGADQFGRNAYALWHVEGIDASHAVTIDGSTMVGVILVERSGENRIVIVPGVLDAFHPRHLDSLASVVAGADVLLTGLEIPIATATAALGIARQAGVTTILNPAPAPSHPLPAATLALVDHLIPNRAEAAMLAGLPTATAPRTLLAAECFDSIPTIVMTLGDRGAVVRTADRTTEIDGVRVDAVDTTGAGDCFNAAYAVALAHGADPLTSAHAAARAAAISVTRPQVIPSLPYANELVSIAGGAT